MIEHDESELDEGRMPLIEHLIELRRRIIVAGVAFLVATVGCYFFSQQIYDFLAQPLAHALRPGQKLIYTEMTEAFTTRIMVAAWAGLCLSFPIIAWQLWLFVAPGLYRHERRALLPYLVVTPLLFVAGGALAYYLVFPAAWHFFLTLFNGRAEPGSIAIEPEIRVSSYLSIVERIVFAFGLVFEIPVGLTLLARVGIVTSAGLRRYRRYAYLANTIAAGVLAPPDMYSMIGLMVPMFMLYEISIWCCRAVEKKRMQVVGG